MASDSRHPLLADTSSLIAVANTDQWELLADTISLTTTNVCKHELQTHASANTHSRRTANAISNGEANACSST